MTNIYDVESYGAVADYAIKTGASITAGSSTLLVPTGNFLATDVGKIALVEGAGASGDVLITTIAGYISPTQITLAVPAITTVSSKRFQYATNSTAAIQAAMNAARVTGGDVRFNSAGGYGVTQLDFTNPTRACRLIGVGPQNWGSRLVPMAVVNAVLDATGHDALVMQNLNLGNASGLVVPNIGLLIGPSVAVPGMDVVILDQVFIDGPFRSMNAYFDRIYGGTMRNCSILGQFQKGGPGSAFTAVFTASNICVAHSVFTTTLPNSTVGSNNDWTFERTEFHNLDLNGGPGVCTTLLLDQMATSTWIGGIIAGGYTGPIQIAGTCTALTFIGVEFSADQPPGYSYMFAGGTMSFPTLINLSPAYLVGRFQTPPINLSTLGRY